MKKLLIFLASILGCFSLVGCRATVSEVEFAGKALSDRFVYVTLKEDNFEGYRIVCDKDTRVLYLVYANPCGKNGCPGHISGISPLLNEDGTPMKHKGAFIE